MPLDTAVPIVTTKEGIIKEAKFDMNSAKPVTPANTPRKGIVDYLERLSQLFESSLSDEEWFEFENKEIGDFQNFVKVMSGSMFPALAELNTKDTIFRGNFTMTLCTMPKKPTTVRREIDTKLRN